MVFSKSTGAIQSGRLQAPLVKAFFAGGHFPGSHSIILKTSAPFDELIIYLLHDLNWI